MKALKTFGLILFIIGFISFNLLFFTGTYRSSQADVVALVNGSLRQQLLLEAMNKEHLLTSDASVFDFVGSVKRAIAEVNTRQQNQHQITTSDINKITESTPDLTPTQSIFEQAVAGDSIKTHLLHTYGSWLYGQKFDSKEALNSKLQEVANQIHSYGLLREIGFDKYAAKDLRYNLTRKALTSNVTKNPWLFLALTIGLCIIGALVYTMPKLQEHGGVQNNGVFFNPMKNTQWLGIMTGTWLIAFYVFLYFYPEYMVNWIAMTDPVSQLLNGGEAGRFFLYGFLYTLCILVMGVRFIIHYRFSRYHMLRTASVMFFQTAFAFLIPEILIRLNKPYYDFKNIWPLDYSFFFDSNLNRLIEEGTLGIFMLVWGIVLIIVAVPVMVYFFGKRWYCSWVCGCGGLAETLGDPYRQLSQKSVKAWKIERYVIHGVLGFAIIMTAGVLYTYFTGASWVLITDTYTLREVYGVYIGAGFAGVIGTGFYPLMGNRVWCRYGCPLAAYLGLVQRFKSRFRITTNGGQCISCGNCSTYCEMGIDVRWYAQRGQNIVRSSCVGCGVCSSVCPRGVLNLETRDEEGRFGKPILIGNNHVKIVD